jgi:hypothetical protein
MKRRLIFPALALLAAIGTSTFAGLLIDPSTEVSEAVATQASGGAVCSYWNSGYCGSNVPPPCVYSLGYIGGTGFRGYATSETFCGVLSCGSVNVVAPGCGTTTTTVTVP